MAELFYEITQAEADLIGKFTINDHSGIDPYCGKQTNGNWIIGKDIVDLHANRPEIQTVDFASKTAKTVAQLDFEPEA